MSASRADLETRLSEPNTNRQTFRQFAMAFADESAKAWAAARAFDTRTIDQKAQDAVEGRS